MTQTLPVIQMTSSRAVPGTEARPHRATPQHKRAAAGTRSLRTASRLRAINTGAHNRAGVKPRLLLPIRRSDWISSRPRAAIPQRPVNHRGVRTAQTVRYKLHSRRCYKVRRTLVSFSCSFRP